MFEAAQIGDSALLLQAVDAGLPVNLTNEKGNTLLMLAAYAGHTELTKSLIIRVADPNRLNDLEQSMVAGAAFKAHDGIVHALIDASANPRLRTSNAIRTAHIMFNRKDLMEVFKYEGRRC